MSITNEERDALRQRWPRNALPSINRDFNLVLDALDEMERERDDALMASGEAFERAHHSEAVTEWKARAAAALRNAEAMVASLNQWQDAAREALGEYGLGTPVPTLIRDLRARAEKAEADLAAAQEVGCARSDHAHCARMTKERDEKHAALLKVNAIRNSIVGMQGFNFSEHAYPLVAALNAAGYEGEPYPVARANLGTLIEQTKKAEAEAAVMREALLSGAVTDGPESFDRVINNDVCEDALATGAGERLLKDMEKLRDDVRNLQDEGWRKEYEAQTARDGASIIILQMAIREYIEANGSINKDGLYAAMKQTGASLE